MAFAPKYRDCNYMIMLLISWYNMIYEIYNKYIIIIPYITWYHGPVDHKSNLYGKYNQQIGASLK